MAKVQFKRIWDGDKVNTIPKVDGQMIYTGDGKQYMDWGSTRIQISGGGGSAGTNGTILWENSDYSSSYAGGNITLSSDDFDVLEWYFLSNTATVGAETPSIVSVKTCRPFSPSFPTRVQFITGFGTSTIQIRQREFTRRSGYDQNYWYMNYGQRQNIGEDHYTTDNNCLIPILVIGYKVDE